MGVATSQLVKGLGTGVVQWVSSLVLTATDSVTALFTVDQSGNCTANSFTGPLTGAVTATDVSTATLEASGLVTSSVAAGSPVLKFVATNATPTVAWTGSTGSHINTTAPAGYLQVVVGSTPYYIPYWA